MVCFMSRQFDIIAKQCLNKTDDICDVKIMVNQKKISPKRRY